MENIHKKYNNKRIIIDVNTFSHWKIMNSQKNHKTSTVRQLAYHQTMWTPGHLQPLPCQDCQHLTLRRCFSMLINGLTFKTLLLLSFNREVSLVRVKTACNFY